MPPFLDRGLARAWWAWARPAHVGVGVARAGGKKCIAHTSVALGCSVVGLTTMAEVFSASSGTEIGAGSAPWRSFVGHRLETHETFPKTTNLVVWCDRTHRGRYTALLVLEQRKVGLWTQAVSNGRNTLTSVSFSVAAKDEGGASGSDCGSGCVRQTMSGVRHIIE